MFLLEAAELVSRVLCHIYQALALVDDACARTHGRVHVDQMRWDNCHFLRAIVFHCVPSHLRNRRADSHGTAKSVAVLLYDWRFDDIVAAIQVVVRKDLRQLLTCYGILGTLNLLIVDVGVVIERRHLSCKSIYWSTELVERMSVFKLATTLSSMTLTIVTLKS